MKKAGYAFLRLFALMFCAFSMIAASAQSVNVIGTVLDTEGEPLIGATVQLKSNSKVAVATDINGKFVIQVPDLKESLIVSYVGCETQTVDLKGRSDVKVYMTNDAQVLEEMVVVGYGKQKKVHLTGSVAAVGAKDLTIAPMSNVSNMLTGKIPGLTATQSTGQPGSDGAALKVRGETTWLGSSPLVIVDGVERDLNSVNPNDIENVSVLKDAAAAVYGVKGANGVILVTTKQGEGAPKISYQMALTAVKNTAFPEYLNASEFMYYKNKALMMDGMSPLYSADIQQAVLTGNGNPDTPWGETDWFDMIFRTGFTQQHNISASGASERVKYFASLGYYDQEGTIKETDYFRYNARMNLDIKVAKNLTFSATMSGVHNGHNAPGAGFLKQDEINVVRQASNTAPIIKPEWNGYMQAWKEGDAINVNPYAALYNSGYTQYRAYQYASTYKLEYDFSDLWAPLKGLGVNAFFAYDYSHSKTKTYNQGYKLLAYSNATLESKVENAYGISSDSALQRYENDYWMWMFRPSVFYNRTFGKHSVGALFLMEKKRAYTDMLWAHARKFATSDPIDITLGTDTENAQNPQGEHQHTGSLSYVGRFNYAFDDKYLFEFAFRQDESYVFAPENRKGFFPSVSAGWVASRESFLEDIEWLDFLKLRASYGEMGSDNVTPFQYNKLFNAYKDNYVLGSAAITQYTPTTAYVFRDLTWTTTKTYNVGLDFNLFHDKLGAEIDVFYKHTTGILEGTGGAYPGSLGGYYPDNSNSGEMDDRGFEIALNHALALTKDFSYRVRGSFSFARNKVLKRKLSDTYPNYRGVLGQPLGARFGFHCLGLFQTQEQIDQYPVAPSGETLLGDIMYQDVNGDGIISRDFDYVKIGYGALPEISFSLTMDLNYKDFYLNMLWQGVTHCDYQLQGVYDTGVTASTVYTSSFGTGNSPKYLIEGAWTPENTNAKYPRLSTVPRFNNAWVSDWWVVNGEYLRLKNIQFGYNMPSKLLTHTPFTGVNVYVAGSNVLTFSHFKYIDPESPSVSNGYYPQSATYTFGLNVSF